MATNRGKSFWEKLVREVESGESQSSVARRHRVSPSWLGRWCRQSAKERPATGTLLPVRVVDERAPRFEIFVGPFTVAFEQGIDPAYVAAIVRCLSK